MFHCLVHAIFSLMDQRWQFGIFNKVVEKMCSIIILLQTANSHQLRANSALKKMKFVWKSICLSFFSLLENDRELQYSVSYYFNFFEFFYAVESFALYLILSTRKGKKIAAKSDRPFYQSIHAFDIGIGRSNEFK